MIYEYTDYRAYLTDFYRSQKAKNPWYSFRVFADRANLASPNYLKLVMDNKRRITDKTLERFVKGLNLNSLEAQYFRALVKYNECFDHTQKNFLKDELARLRRIAGTVPVVRSNDHDILKHWYTWAIREMVLLKDFVLDPRAIVARLRNSISEQSASFSLTLLKRLNYIGTLPSGRSVLRAPVLSTTHEISSTSIRNLHGQFLRLAYDAVFTLPVAERSINGVTIALPTAKIDEVREKIKLLCKEISEMFDETYQNDNVYHVVVTFFPLTKSADQ